MKKCLVVILLLFAINIQSQEKLKDTIKINEVIIDASKNNQKIQKIPIAASVIQAKQIEVQKMDNATGINGIVPNIFIPEHGTRLNTDIYIRGVGVSKGEPSTGIYVDDIPYFDSGTINFEFFDIKKIEVLRSPQGTLYGRNTMAGLLKVYTPDPVLHRKAKLQLNYGSLNEYKGGLSYNQPISKNTAVLVDGFIKHSDGYFVNRFNNKKVDKQDTYGGRVKVKFDISDKLFGKVLFNAENSKQPGFAYGVYDIATQTVADVNYNEPSKYNRDFVSTGLNLNYDVRNFSISFAGSYQKLSDIYHVDQDFTPTNIYIVDLKRNNATFVEELNIKSKATSKLQWIGGLFAFQRSLLKNVDFDINSSRGSITFLKDHDQTINAYAVFGQVKYPIRKFEITAGMRYDIEGSNLKYNYDLLRSGKKIHKNDFDHHLNFNQVLPKFGLSYVPNENITVYTSISKGYKAGGFNATFEREEDETFEPEYSYDYEAGAKFLALKNKLIGNVSLFFIDWSQQQVVQSVPSGRGIMIKNAGKSESKGVEFEANYHFNNQLSFGFNYGYTVARFITYRYSDAEDYSGNKLPLVPKYTFGSFINYKWQLRNSKIEYILFHSNYRRFGNYFWTADNTDRQKMYGLLNATISIKLKNASIGIWAKNLTGERYNKYYFRFSSLHKSYAEASRPLSFGVIAKLKLF